MAKARAEPWKFEKKVEQGDYGQIHFAPSIKSLASIANTSVSFRISFFFFFAG